MWPLDAPVVDVRQTYRACREYFRANDDLKTRYELIEDLIVDAARAFEMAAGNGELHTLEAEELVGGLVTKAEMVNLYNYGMLKKTSSGRAIYERIVKSPDHGRCPLCGERKASTLDHHLEKTKYPGFSVNPLNLVPCCRDCNFAKRDGLLKGPTDASLHPYFENINKVLWLEAAVEPGPPLTALRFYVQPPAEWSEVLRKRVKRQFKMLGLAALYATKAGEEMSSRQHRWQETFNGPDGENKLREHLELEAITCAKHRINAWQTATYRALSSSAWFYQGGVAQKQ